MKWEDQIHSGLQGPLHWKHWGPDFWHQGWWNDYTTKFVELFYNLIPNTPPPFPPSRLFSVIFRKVKITKYGTRHLQTKNNLRSKFEVLQNLFLWKFLLTFCSSTFSRSPLWLLLLSSSHAWILISSFFSNLFHVLKYHLFLFTITLRHFILFCFRMPLQLSILH